MLALEQRISGVTIAISVKVNDAVVLAADSATTFFAQTALGNPPLITKVYNHADKIANLYKGLPIGLMTWGAAHIGTAAIATLAKDLRRRLTGNDPDHPDWTLNASTYTIEEVAQRVFDFMYTELYVPSFSSWPEKPALGFLIAGFSAGKPMAEEWQIEIEQPSGGSTGPTAVRAIDQTGWWSWGQPEPLTRLLIGFDWRLFDYLRTNLPTGTDVDSVVNGFRSQVEVSLVNPAMPLQDAIDLAVYLVDVVHRFVHFNGGAETVGGAIDVAAITRHEGFKWIRRKHYYPAALNPAVEGG